MHFLLIAAQSMALFCSQSLIDSYSETGVVLGTLTVASVLSTLLPAKKSEAS